MRIPTLLILSLLLTATSHAQQSVRFGLNSFLGNIDHSEIRASLVKKTEVDRTNYFDAMAELGVKSIRETFMNWAEIEPVQGAGYLWAPYDDLARKASERGIEIIALAYPFPDWATGATPTPPEQLFTPMWRLPERAFEVEFRAFVSATVRRYCGQHPESLELEVPIRHWIFSNELDAFGIAPDEYAFWLKAFWEEVKEADPGAKVLTMGFAYGIRKPYFGELLDCDSLQGPDYPYFDIVAWHCYPGNFGHPNIYALDTYEGYFRGELAEHGIEAETWLTEIGDRCKDDREQAARDIKYVLHGASTGVRQVNLHGLWDIGENHDWGLLENAPSGAVPEKKPSFTAYQTLLEKIGDNRGVEFLGPGHYRASLADGTAVYILWAEGPQERRCLPLEGMVRVTDLRQNVRKLRADELQLTEEPVFVEAAEEA